MDFRELLNSEQYDFIRTSERLGSRIMLLGLGGSYAYGTSNEGSDIDFRGITLNLPSDLIGLTEFEQYEDNETDTVIYSFNKMVKLLLDCNPNTCEILGLDEDQYLIKSPLGQELIDNAGIFLSMKAVKSFSNYAMDQLRRLQNAIARDSLPQAEKEKHILNSVRRAVEQFNLNGGSDKTGSGDFRLSLDLSEEPSMEAEIFVDAEFRHYPLRKFSELTGRTRAVLRDYERLTGRNKKKDSNHLNKHAMHLVRLLMMAADIIGKKKIITHRTADLPVLLSIRRGDYMLEDGRYSPDFFKIVDEYDQKLQEAVRHHVLPDEPDMRAVARLVERVNYYAVTGKYHDYET